MNILIRSVPEFILAALDADAARKRQSRQDRLLDILAQHYGEFVGTRGRRVSTMTPTRGGHE